MGIIGILVLIIGAMIAGFAFDDNKRGKVLTLIFTVLIGALFITADIELGRNPKTDEITEITTRLHTNRGKIIDFTEPMKVHIKIKEYHPMASFFTDEYEYTVEPMEFD